MRFFGPSVVLLTMMIAPAPTVSALTSQASKSALASHPDWPEASASDADTIEHIVHSFYKAISAPAGGKLNQHRLLSLFVPDGRVVVSVDPTSSHPSDVKFLTPEEYAAISDAHTATTGFFDSDLGDKIESFGVMTHVYSTYESRSNANDPKPIARGIKSFELVHSRNRWYIVQVYWDYETSDNPLPRQYLYND